MMQPREAYRRLPVDSLFSSTLILYNSTDFLYGCFQCPGCALLSLYLRPVALTPPSHLPAFKRDRPFKHASPTLPSISSNLPGALPCRALNPIRTSQNERRKGDALAPPLHGVGLKKQWIAPPSSSLRLRAPSEDSFLTSHSTYTNRIERTMTQSAPRPSCDSPVAGFVTSFSALTVKTSTLGSAT